MVFTVHIRQKKLDQSRLVDWLYAYAVFDDLTEYIILLYNDIIIMLYDEVIRYVMLL